jgi:hypothetical protein
MNAARTLSFAVLCCLALAACDPAPTFDASSLPAYQKSLNEINARLSAQDRHKLQLALLTLAAGGSADYTAVALANPLTIANIEALDGVPNPLQFLDRMRSRIEGRTAASVIRRVADDLDYAISRVEAQTKGAEKQLAAFVIENPRFRWDHGKRTTNPTAEFSVYNGSTMPISRIFLKGELTTPELKTPLAMGVVVYSFANLLQPGAQQQVTVNLGTPSGWTAKQLETVYNPDLKLTVSNVDDASNRRLLAVNTEVLETLRHKRDLLRGS